jgi:hypothetical protein
MSVKRKIILLFCIIALVVLVALCGGFLYYYYHPAAVKALMEKSISRATGLSFSIERLSYSLNPLRIQAKGITARPHKDLGGFHLAIDDLEADIGLGGPFGHKTLTFKKLRVNGFLFRISRGMSLREILPKAKGPSLFGQMVKWIIGSFLFKEIAFQEAELEGGTAGAELDNLVVQAAGIHASLNPEHLVEISCSAELEWPLERMTLTTPHILITTDQAISILKTQIKGTFTAQNMRLQSPAANAKNMEVKSRFVYEHKDKKVNFEPLEFRLQELRLKKGDETSAFPLNLYFKTEGLLNLQKMDLNATLFLLTVADVLELQGKLRGFIEPESSLSLELFDSKLFPEKLMRFLPERVRRQLLPFTLSGPVELKGSIKGVKEQQEWIWQSNLQARLLQNLYSYRTKEIQLNGKVTGDIQVEGKFPRIRLTVTLKDEQAVLSSKAAELKPFSTSLSLSGIYPVFEIRELKFHIPEAKVAVGAKDLLIADIEAHLRGGSVHGEEKSLILPEIRLSSSLVKNLFLSLEAQQEKVGIRLKGEQTNLINAARILNLLPSGWQFSGADSVYLSVNQGKKGEWLFVSNLDLSKFGFQNQDSSFVGERISARAAMEGKIYTLDPRLVVNASMRVDSGEILYDRFYLDLKKNMLFSSCEGVYDISGKSLQLSNLILGLKDILTLSVHGTLLHKGKDGYARVSLNIPETALKPAFDYLVREPFRVEKPLLASIEVGGDISADLTLTGNRADWALTGHWRWHGGEFSLGGGGGVGFHGIDLDLPVWYQTRQQNDNKGPVNGDLSIKSMVLPLLPEQPLVLGLSAGPNLLSMRIPTSIEIPGGYVKVGTTVCRNLFSSRPSIETSLILNMDHIDPVISKKWPEPVEGSIRGKLAPVNFEGGAVRSHGEIRVSAFGGEIMFSNIGASGLFSSAPVFKLSGLWKDLSLAELTRSTSFGKIEGVLKGSIKDLEIAYGQPQRFDLLLETVKKKGVPQKISVRAVDNIALIGGGQSPFVGLAGSLASLFRNFPYEQIGVHAFLENDVFRINGTIREGGIEYLVKRSGISGVNVVNQNPDNRISFKDMVKRIKRVTAGSGGPVIK